MYKILSIFALINALIIASCGPTDDGQKGKKRGEELGVSVKDQTPPPGLQTNVPAKADTTGWAAVKTTALDQLPEKGPAKNTLYYSAAKEMGGKERTIDVVFGNIVREKDTIVNAANGSLLGGSGVDKAVHEAADIAGIEDERKQPLYKEALVYKALHNIEFFPAGSAMVTNAYGPLLPDVKLIVHTVGPSGDANPETIQKLYSAIYNSLLKADEYGAKSVSIPAVSTGIYGFPLDTGCELFFKAALQFYIDHPDTSIEHIRFTNIDHKTVKAVATEFLKLFPSS